MGPNVCSCKRTDNKVTKDMDLTTPADTKKEKKKFFSRKRKEKKEAKEIKEENIDENNDDNMYNAVSVCYEPID